MRVEQPARIRGLIQVIAQAALILLGEKFQPLLGGVDRRGEFFEILLELTRTSARRFQARLAFRPDDAGLAPEKPGKHVVASRLPATTASSCSSSMRASSDRSSARLFEQSLVSLARFAQFFGIVVREHEIADEIEKQARRKLRNGPDRS